MSRHFDWRSFTARALFGFFLVFALYNPTGHSYLHWVVGGEGGAWLKLTAGLLLLGGHLIVWITIKSVLRLGGSLLVLATVFAAWLTIAELGGLAAFAPENLLSALMVALALLYAAGLSFGHLHHRMSGVAHVEPVH